MSSFAWRLLRLCCLLLFSISLYPSSARSAPSVPIRPSAGRAAQPSVEEVRRALQAEDFYVAPAMAATLPPARVQALLARTALHHITAKVVAVRDLPPGVASAGQLATGLRRGLDGDPLVVVLTGNAVAASGGGLSESQLSEITDREERVFDSEGYIAGLGLILQSADADRDAAFVLRLQCAGTAAFVLLLAGGIALHRRRRRVAVLLRSAEKASIHLAANMAKGTAEALHAPTGDDKSAAVAKRAPSA